MGKLAIQDPSPLTCDYITHSTSPTSSLPPARPPPNMPPSDPSKPSTLRRSQEAYLERVRQQAPNRCEICDDMLPTFADREKHVSATKHCACFECKRYVPPGFVYSHWCEMHDGLS